MDSEEEGGFSLAFIKTKRGIREIYTHTLTHPNIHTYAQPWL